MLSDKSRPIVEATLPDLQERINEITPKFYDRMLSERTDLLDGMFSRVDQIKGKQPRALAASIPFFANYILANPDDYPDEILLRVAHKHASLGVPRHEYETVYKYLFEAIKEDFGDDYTPEFEEAWTEVYWLMADVLIKLEDGLYNIQANNQHFAPFKLIKCEETGKDVLDMTFEAADGTPMTKALAGQYISIVTKTTDGLRQPRQFSLLPSKANERRIAVKVLADGEISPRLKELEIGDIVDISNPYGDVTADKTDSTLHRPLYIFTSGIGIAPALSYVHRIAVTDPKRTVIAVHRDKSLETWPLREEYVNMVEGLENGKVISFLEAPDEGTFTGDLNMRKIEVIPGSFAFMCGSITFMQNARSKLINGGVPGRNIQYEIFGADELMHQGTRRAMHRRRY